MFKPIISTIVGKLYAVRPTSAATAASRSSTWGSTPARCSRRWSPDGSPIRCSARTPRRPTSTSSSPRASACWSASSGSTWAGHVSRASARRQPEAAGPHARGLRRDRRALRDPGRLLPARAGRPADCSTCSPLLFVILAVMLVMEGIREGKVARDKVIAMMIIFTFNILFWMFFEQAGSSFTFLADKIVNRDLGPAVRLPDRLVPERELGRDHRAGAGHRVDLGLAGRQSQPVDPAQVRPRAGVQRPRVPAADVRAVEPRRAPTARSRSGRWWPSTSSSRSASCASRPSACRW